MSKKIFISLPVTNLNKSIDFYTAIGCVKEPTFSDDGGACMVWSDAISVMLLTHDKWRTFTTRPIPPATHSEVGLNISCDSREAVDAMHDAAVKHGGTADINSIQDMGFMYGRDFLDPDGHVWGAMWMDEGAVAGVE